MTRKELIKKNQNEFSSIRKWAYGYKYREPISMLAITKKMFKDLKDPNAIIYGVGFAAPTAAFAATAAGAAAGGVAAGVFVAAPLVIVKAADMLDRLDLGKMATRAMLRMSDGASRIFRRIADRFEMTPDDVACSREMAVSLARLKYHAESIPGIVKSSKDRFNPETNIYLPVSEIESGSPLFAKNREIFNEIVRMSKAGVLTPEDLAEIDVFMKGATSFAADEPQYNHRVNYAVAIRKIDQIHERVSQINVARESLKTDDAQPIERSARKEERNRIIDRSVADLNGELGEKIEALKSEIEAQPADTTASSAGDEAGKTEVQVAAVVKPFHEMSREEYEAHMAAIHTIASGAPEGSELEDAVKAVSSKTTAPSLK